MHQERQGKNQQQILKIFMATQDFQNLFQGTCKDRYSELTNTHGMK